MAKTKKAVTKRFRQTKTGKLMQRKPHQDHFNAKTSGAVRMAKKGQESMKNITNKKAIITRYITNK